MSLSFNKTIARRWAAFERLMKLPELQRDTLVRRRLPAWLRPRPVELTTLKRRALSAPLMERKPGEGVVLTCVPHPTTGFGHRFAEWNAGLIVARKAGVPFLNAGLGESWDEELGIGGNFTGAAAYLKRKGWPVVRLPLVEWHGRKETADDLALMVREVSAAMKNAVIMLGDGQNLYRQHDSAEELRTMYRRSAKRSVRSGDPVRIAVHIRRGDVARMKADGHGDWQARFVAVSWFVDVLRAILNGVGDQPVEIEIFSQGVRAEFLAFEAFGTPRFHLDADPVWTFHRMATADVLITSPSSYSFNAALFNPGIKIARTPWWHEIPQDDGWLGVSGTDPDAGTISSFVRENLDRRDPKIGNR